MKRIVVLFIAAFVSAVSAFSQTFAIEGFVSTDAESVRPNIGISVDMAKVNFMAGINFRFNEDKVEYKPSAGYRGYDTSEKWNAIGIYAGIAPRVFSTEKLTILLPILAQFRFGETGEFESQNDNARRSNELKSAKYFGIDALFGAKAVYALSNRWSLFAGFLILVVDWTKFEDIYYMYAAPSSDTYTRTEEYTRIFSSGFLQLGVKMSF